MLPSCMLLFRGSPLAGPVRPESCLSGTQALFPDFRNSTCCSLFLECAPTPPLSHSCLATVDPGTLSWNHNASFSTVTTLVQRVTSCIQSCGAFLRADRETQATNLKALEGPDCCLQPHLSVCVLWVWASLCALSSFKSDLRLYFRDRPSLYSIS